MLGAPAAVVESYRQAVFAAEAQTEQTGSSALSAPGIALPAAPVLPDPTCHVERLRLIDASGEPVTQAASDARLDVAIDWKAEPGTSVAVTVGLATEGGTALFSTTLEAGVSAGSGSARLSISRLGVAEGAYQVSASAHPPGGAAAQWVTCPLLVTAHAPGAGLLRPAHVWTLNVGPPS